MASRRRRSYTNPRRATQWALSDSLPSSNTIVSATAAWDGGTPIVYDLLGGLETELGYILNNITVVRIHGFVRGAADTFEESAAIGLAAGIAFFPDTLSSSGDYPNPGLDNYDWMWHSHGFEQQVIGASFTDVPVHRQPDIRLHIDNKSARKKRENSQNLKLVVAGKVSPSGNINTHFAARTLIKLP